MVLGNKHLARHHVLLLILTYVVRGHTLQCHQTEYQLNENLCCPKCPIGSQVRSDCTKRGSTSCQLCLNGTYMNIPTGLKNCLPCTNCNAVLYVLLHTRGSVMNRCKDRPVQFASSDFIWFPRSSLNCRQFKSSPKDHRTYSAPSYNCHITDLVWR
ncbi:tumor necrosis factor receptor superfamily member 5-like isoform X6 [Hippocampus comes]|uniref:tumor necrosis factor receptor superfamily member 5-like isoform X6 n=1 Tax=Hippocampus comes TaxID=109280 RepID=UPI00094F0B3A|nr:PREDICTED: tumor necrosis factor receptor superfamily member 5-like isoform X6 [Hippocampus comes]